MHILKRVKRDFNNGLLIAISLVLLGAFSKVNLDVSPAVDKRDRSEFSFENVPKMLLRPRAAGEREEHAGKKVSQIERLLKKQAEKAGGIDKPTLIRFEVAGKTVPVEWYDAGTTICQIWKRARFGINSASEDLNHNMRAILELLIKQIATEKSDILLNIGAGPSALFNIGNVTAVNNDTRDETLWRKWCQSEDAYYVPGNLASLPQYIKKIRAFSPKGHIQFITLCTDMVGWLKEYLEEVYLPLPRQYHHLDTDGKIDAMLQNAWSVLEGSDAFLIATEPGCVEFKNRAHVFSNKLYKIIVIGDRIDDYSEAKAIIFWKQRWGMVESGKPNPSIQKAARALHSSILRPRAFMSPRRAIPEGTTLQIQNGIEKQLQHAI